MKLSANEMTMDSLFPVFANSPGVVPGMAWYGLRNLHKPPMALLTDLYPAGFRLLETAEFANAEHLKAVRDAGLHVGAAVTGISHQDEIAPLLNTAKNAGAGYVRLKLLSAWATVKEVADALDVLLRVSADLRLPVHVETHRETVSQDLCRWIEHVYQRSQLRLTLDISHYRITGDWPETPRNDRQRQAHHHILQRTSGLHLRLCDGEHIQVSPHTGQPLLAWHRQVWQSAVAAWRQQAPLDASFPAVVELLAPPFALVDSTGREMSDRWADALFLGQVAQTLL